MINFNFCFKLKKSVVKLSMEEKIEDNGQEQKEMPELRVFMNMIQNHDHNGVLQQLKQGFNPNTLSWYNRTPLMIAVVENNLEIFNHLIEYGADTTVRDSFGWSALTYLLKKINDQGYSSKNFNHFFTTIIKQNIDLNVEDFKYLKWMDNETCKQTVISWHEKKTLISSTPTDEKISYKIKL